jgi:hypothetical protein
MANVFEAMLNTVKALVDDEPKTPLHVGEAFNCWLYYTAMHEALGYEEEALNMTTDQQAREMLEDAISTCGAQVKKLEQFLTREGVPLPALPAGKPKSDANAVPLGVKRTDDEIANGVSAKVAYMNSMCATTQSSAIRNDVGLMFMEFQAELLTFGATLKSLMRKKGWLRVPPYFVPPGLPNQ